MIVKGNVGGDEKYNIWNDEVIIPLVSCGGNWGLKACIIQDEYSLSNQHMYIVKYGLICHGDSFRL